MYSHFGRGLVDKKCTQGAFDEAFGCQWTWSKAVES